MNKITLWMHYSTGERFAITISIYEMHNIDLIANRLATSLNAYFEFWEQVL